MVLTDCDALGTFPPRTLAPLFRAMRHPGLVACLVPGLRLDKVRHGPLAYGPLSSVPVPSGRTFLPPAHPGELVGEITAAAREAVARDG